MKPKDLKIPFAWEERRPVLLDRFFYIPASYPYSKKEFSFFAREAPIAVEYCSGNGQWIAEQARLKPHLNWIAVEKDFSRARKIWVKDVPNLLVVGGDGLTFTQFYAPKIFEGYINFPDPWPKLRHAKHRLIRKEFVEALSCVMDAGSCLTCATDEARYAEEMKKEFKESGWSLLFHKQEWQDYGASFFRTLWLEKGKTIHYVRYQK